MGPGLTNNADVFRGCPLVLTNPATGDLKIALAAKVGTGPGATTVGVAYRVSSGTGLLTITDSSAVTATWQHQPGEGYRFGISDIVAPSTVVLVWY